ncbi:hypothetical protein [Maribacter sp. LLG6340-A2]|uniref:hypothetical protein n=1 Tax=Maribacter sp. LLG6340-A2 TaxID=3160834 RepID=UPI0038684354
MKRVKEHNIFEYIREIREFDFGVFYFFNGGIVISEMHEGVLFKWDNAKKAVNAAQEIYNDDIPLIYIANRINRYYVAPLDWFKFYKNRFDMQHIAAVGPLKCHMLSLILKKIIFPKRIKSFSDLNNAVDWAKKISEQALWTDER